jgi:hypothetical protein
METLNLILNLLPGASEQWDQYFEAFFSRLKIPNQPQQAELNFIWL